MLLISYSSHRNQIFMKQNIKDKELFIMVINTNCSYSDLPHHLWQPRRVREAAPYEKTQPEANIKTAVYAKMVGRGNTSAPSCLRIIR